ncbi:hypothetical protein IJJ12_01400 [bacterium]|nr:hypothetical protein [bacterium]
MPRNSQTTVAGERKVTRRRRVKKVEVQPEKVEVVQKKYTEKPPLVVSNWQGGWALVTAVLSVYFLLVPGVDFVLAVLAIVFGILGLKTVQRLGSMIALIVGVVNACLSFGVTVIGLVIWLVAVGASENIDEMVDRREWREMRPRQEEMVEEREVRVPAGRGSTLQRSSSGAMERGEQVDNQRGTVQLSAPAMDDGFPEMITIDRFGNVTAVPNGQF